MVGDAEDLLRAILADEELMAAAVKKETRVLIDQAAGFLAARPQEIGGHPRFYVETDGAVHMAPPGEEHGSQVLGKFDISDGWRICEALRRAYKAGSRDRARRLRNLLGVN